MRAEDLRKLLRPLVLAAVVLASGAIAFWLTWPENNQHEEDARFSFDGSSKDLKATVVVPTLDTPIPEGKSAIWCGSFQLAWDRLKNDLAKEPIQFQIPNATAERLNRAEFSESNLEPKSFFAAAGLVKDGIVKAIRTKMARKFPHAPQPMFDVADNVAVAYAYLRARVAFDIPYFANDEPFPFTDLSGQTALVQSFGMSKKDDNAYLPLRDQVRILHERNEQEKVVEFVLDPCHTSQPNQILLAQVPRKETLAELLIDIEKKMLEEPSWRAVPRLAPRDTLLVPNMNWRIVHRFQELEGANGIFANANLQGLHLDTAEQMVQFRLDRSGAELASEAKLLYRAPVAYFEFNRPYLIVMKKRDADRPFFVMWVANAELLCKW